MMVFREANGEKVQEIPALTNGSTNYKDFKVSFNGGIESTSSIKSFKWSLIIRRPILPTISPINKSLKITLFYVII